MYTQIAIAADGNVEPLSFGPLVIGERPIVPSAVSVEIRINGVIFPLDNLPTIDSTDGSVSYIWTSDESTRLGAIAPLLAARAIWNLSFDTGNQVRVQYYDIVQFHLISGFDAAQLVQAFPALESARMQYRRVATGGSATTIADTGEALVPPSQRIGARITLISGQGRGQSRHIKSIDISTLTMSFDRPLDSSAVVSAGDAYDITESYDGLIREAWELVIQYLRRILGDISMPSILDGSDLFHIHKQLALQLACERARIAPNDRFDLAAKSYAQSVTNATQSLNIKRDPALELTPAAENINSAAFPVWAR